MAFALAFDFGLAGAWGGVWHPDTRAMASKRQMMFSENRITRDHDTTASQSNCAEDPALSGSL